MTNILSVLLAAFAVLSGPDGKLNVTLESSPDGAVLYSVDYGGEPMLEPASLGLWRRTATTRGSSTRERSARP